MITQNQIIINISDIIKTSAPGREQPILLLLYFQEKESICSAVRDSLFLTHKSPHEYASAQTISRWIKDVLAANGINVVTFSAHSTRHAATSSAKSAGFSVDSIRKIAGWTPISQTFAKFYNRPTIVENFARSLLEPRLT